MHSEPVLENVARSFQKKFGYENIEDRHVDHILFSLVLLFDIWRCVCDQQCMQYAVLKIMHINYKDWFNSYVH